MLTAIKRYNVDSMGLMTIAGTETFSHDAMGNPTSYALKTLTWSGKQLIRYYYQPGKNQLYNYTYAYDENGLRTQKVLNGVTTSYYYNGSVLMGMVTGSGNSAIHQLFSYDSSGNVVSVDYSSNGGSTFTTYYYLRNAQNDIVKIIDGSGNTVVQYTYDSWGKPISTTGSLSATLGANQPFRYRGYVYDTETGWYYLQSRYYDPSVGRFVSADVLLSTGQGVIGHNSYAYCGNNPISRSDPSGYSWWDDLKEALAVVAVVAIVVAVVAVAVVATVSTGGGALVLAGGGIMAASSVAASATAVATAATGVAVTSAVGAGAIAVGQNIAYSRPPNQRNGTPRNNQAQNKQFRDAMQKARIKNKDIINQIHREISGLDFSYKEILEYARDFIKFLPK